ncbi:hypothetical protein CTAYLR_005525 [Chrysophaeum taylorii]|uniref:Translation initiation factor IF-2, chloroplastic n=1 Tax=Chrysophaeum taylorii TaxID=2483200 RepID=A0AAD7U511_9STRA|nr:hypothetical protein CTAYLR_005525 [Chrysophaeum taylorii]
MAGAVVVVLLAVMTRAFQVVAPVCRVGTRVSATVDESVVLLTEPMLLKRKGEEAEGPKAAPPPSKAKTKATAKATATATAAAPRAPSPARDERRRTRKTYDAPRRREPAARAQQFRGAKGSLKKKRNREEKKATVEEVPPVKIGASVGVQELGEKLGKSGTEIVKTLMLKVGVLASVTERVDAATAKAVCEAYGRECVDEEEDVAVVEEEEEDEASLASRAPVVTIMGHVDHGKTSLLDAIRNTRVAEGEAGGITQGIGAYSVEVEGSKRVTFIDTPGHAAFRDMRARGANVTDVVVLVVAADDGVKEQTVDSIACAKTAGVPVVVAVNKMDVDGADPGKVEAELMSYDLVPEELGGETMLARVSAKEGAGLDDLLEKIMLQAELLELKANPHREASGVVVEASVEKGLGVVATTLVQRGTLRIGDCFAAGTAWGKVRALFDDKGAPVTEAGPSTAVRVVGWQSGADRAPAAGELLAAAPDEQTARKLADARHAIASEQRAARLRAATQRQFSRFVTSVGGDVPKEERPYYVVVKADCAGSVEALASSFQNLDVEDDVSKVKAEIVFSGVGDVTKSDVAVASVSDADVVAFNVGANAAAIEEERRLSGSVGILYYDVVYAALDDLELKMRRVLSPTPDGDLVGTAIVKQLFDIGKLGKVAGCGVESGYIRRGANFRVMDGDRIKHQGKLRTLRNVKTDVDRVDAGQDCGLSFQGYEDYAVGDLIECYDS